jgi:hypothetical protein
MDYTYRGDKLTDPALKGMQCSAVRRPDGKCIRGRNGNMLVVDGAGRLHNILGRQLRKNIPPATVAEESA